MSRNEYLNDPNLANYDKYLILLDEGLTNQEIAKILDVKPRTVQRYAYGPSGKYPYFENWNGTPLETNYINQEELVGLRKLVEDSDLIHQDRFIFLLKDNREKNVGSARSLDEIKSMQLYPYSSEQEHRNLEVAIKYGLDYSDLNKVTIQINNTKEDYKNINSILLAELAEQVNKMNEIIDHLNKGESIDLDRMKPSDELEMLVDLVHKD